MAKTLCGRAFAVRSEMVGRNFKCKDTKKQDDSKENRVGFGVWFKSLVSGKESGKK